MKRLIISIYILIQASCFLQAGLNPAVTVSDTMPRVLIINSYCADTDASKSVIDRVVGRLNQEFVDIHIHVGHMNLNKIPTFTSPVFALRHILWSYAYSTNATVSAEDNRLHSLFFSGELPDVLVFIGNEALLYFQRFAPISGKWRDVPMVVCGASEKVTGRLWEPGRKVDYALLRPVEERRETRFFVTEKNKAVLDEGLQYEKGESEGVPGYYAIVAHNLTGVKSTLTIRDNLELILHLMPDLKEIVWIDDHCYSSDYMKWLLEKELSDGYAGIKLSEIHQNRFNTDSIYAEMVKPASDKIYLTYLWDVEGVYSRFSDEQIKHSFVQHSTVPMFSLTERFLSNPYWIGGNYRSYNELANKTVTLIKRILQGEPANSIPFEVIEGKEIILNYALLKKYKLLNAAKTLPERTFVNIPPTFYEKNEKEILISAIVGAILLGALAYWLKRIRYMGRMHSEYIQYEKLYNKLHLIYRHTSIDMALYDAEGKLLFSITEEMQTSLEYEKNTLFPNNLFESDDINFQLKEQIRNNQPINTEIVVSRDKKLSSLDSKRQIYQLIVKPLREKNLQSAKYVAIGIDLNPFVREREERERFGALVRFASNSSQVGIAFYDIETGEGVATNSWYRNLGEQFNSKLLPTYSNVMPEDRRLIIDFRERLRRGDVTEPFQKDIRVLDEKGKVHWITQHIFAKADERNSLIELNMNIDEQKKNENKLRKTKERAERAVVETQEFLANINHEIRTPLNSIVGFSAILAASENEEARKEYVSIILKNNKLLTMLIDDVIALSKIDAGQWEFTNAPVDVNELFEKVVEAGYAELYDKHLTVNVEVDKTHPVIHTDAEAVYRLLNNLFSNAIKFTSEGSVTIGYRKEDTHYYFYVKDTGKGVDSASLQRIFQRFDKLDVYAQGTGLGLALCKSLVAHLGGEIGVESEAGKGSTFWFVLPLPPVTT